MSVVRIQIREYFGILGCLLYVGKFLFLKDVLNALRRTILDVRKLTEKRVLIPVDLDYLN